MSRWVGGGKEWIGEWMGGRREGVGGLVSDGWEERRSGWVSGWVGGGKE